MRICGSRGAIFIAFGAGLITALLFPRKVSIMILAAVLAAAGSAFADTEAGGRLMKVVVVRSPKMIGGILRLIFGIRRERD